MQSRIIFLGTAGDGIVVGKQHRASGGMIIDIDNNYFHINPGPGSLVRAQQFNINLRQNIALLVSSPELIDANDVNAVIESMTYAGLDKHGVLIAHKKVIQDILNPKQKEQITRIISAQPHKKLAIENTDIFILETTSPKNMGFKFYTPNFILSYTGTTGYSSEITEQYQDSDILILNVNNPSNIKIKDQLNTQDAINIIKEITPKLAIITNFGIKMLKADPIYEAREIHKATGIQTIAAKDGFILTPTNYDARHKQTTLLDINKYKEKKVNLKDLDTEELY